MKAVIDGTIGVNMAARTFSVPPSNLIWRNQAWHQVRPFDEAEEEELVEFLKKSAALECGILERVLKKKGKLHDHFNGEGWWLYICKNSSHPTC